MKNEWKRKCQQQNPSYLEPTEQVAEQGKKKGGNEEKVKYVNVSL